MRTEAAPKFCVLRDGAERLLKIRYSLDGIEKNLILRSDPAQPERVFEGS
jgi:hypothetical protein